MNEPLAKAPIAKLTIDNGQLTIVDAGFARADFPNWGYLLHGCFQKSDDVLSAIIGGLQIARIIAE